MAEWQFPNAIAESVKRSAVLRGQSANRLELRDPGERGWPELQRAKPKDWCDSRMGYHAAEGKDPFCRCGRLVAGG